MPSYLKIKIFCWRRKLQPGQDRTDGHTHPHTHPHTHTQPPVVTAISSLPQAGSTKMTKQNLELISDIDMLLMIEKAKRGGISQVCSKRYAKAN